MKHSQLLLAGLLAASVSVPVLAQQNTVLLGILNVQPHSSSSDFRGPFTPAGISVEVQNKVTPHIGYIREINDQWDIEFAMGIPPTHDVVLKVNNAALPGSAQALSGQVGAKIRQVAPTLFANYKFLDKQSALRPFVGIGVNYTKFDHTTSTAAGDALNGGATSISMKDSVGLALQGGVVYRIDDQWSVHATLATARVKSKITTNTLGVERTADISFRPTVFGMSLAYSF